MSEESLDHLVCIAVGGPPLSQWDAKPAVHLWWTAKQRMEVQAQEASQDQAHQVMLRRAQALLLKCTILAWMTGALR